MAHASSAMLSYRLRKARGIVAVECHGTDKLIAARAAGHGILMAPNHCGLPMPEVIRGKLARQTNILAFIMASWRLFMQNWLQTFFFARPGPSVSIAKAWIAAALNTAIDILVEGKRPLVIFPEGVISPPTMRLIRCSTAPRSSRAVRPRSGPKWGDRWSFIRWPCSYHYDGDVRPAVEPVLTEIEARLSWRPQRQLSLEERIGKVGQAASSPLKEIEFLGQAQSGAVGERWRGSSMDCFIAGTGMAQGGAATGTVIARVKKLPRPCFRTWFRANFRKPGRLTALASLADMYLAQQPFGYYPPDYLTANPTPERLLETVERFRGRLDRYLSSLLSSAVTVTVGDAIPVLPAKNAAATIRSWWKSKSNSNRCWGSIHEHFDRRQSVVVGGATTSRLCRGRRWRRGSGRNRSSASGPPSRPLATACTISWPGRTLT